MNFIPCVASPNWPGSSTRLHSGRGEISVPYGPSIGSCACSACARRTCNWSMSEQGLQARIDLVVAPTVALDIAYGTHTCTLRQAPAVKQLPGVQVAARSCSDVGLLPTPNKAHCV